MSDEPACRVCGTTLIDLDLDGAFDGYVCPVLGEDDSDEWEELNCLCFVVDRIRHPQFG